ncbi:MAG: hypothetical protein ACHP8B_01745 [Terriglobales bacterium]
MIKEQELKAVLIALTKNGKMHTGQLMKLKDEVSALRETVRGLDLTFDDVLKQKREKQSDPDNIAETVALYDKIIARLRAGSVC